MNDNIPQWRVGAGGSPIPEDTGAVCLVFSREETCSLRVGRAADDLLQLTERPALARKLAHGVFFSFDGWDTDAREVVAIPECRAYLRALHAQWPYWLHFLAPQADQWQILLLALVHAQPAAAPPGQTAWSVEMSDVRGVVQGMVQPLNLLHQAIGLGKLERAAVFDGSLAAIAQAFGGAR